MSSFFDTEELEVPTVPNEALAKLAILVKELQDKQTILDQKEKELANLKEEVRKLEQITIPELLNSNGLSAAKINGIGIVETKAEYKASIATDKWGQFKVWAAEHGYSDVLKEVTTIENASPDVLQYLSEVTNFETKPDMHWQTLSKIARTLAQEGKKFPDSLSVFSYYKTTIKKG